LEAVLQQAAKERLELERRLAASEVSNCVNVNYDYISTLIDILLVLTDVL